MDRNDYNKSYYEKNKEIISSRSKEYYAKNRDEILARNREYYKTYYPNNIEKFRAKYKRTRPPKEGLTIVKENIVVKFDD